MENYANGDLSQDKCTIGFEEIQVLMFLLFQELILVDSAEEHEGDTGWQDMWYNVSVCFGEIQASATFIPPALLDGQSSPPNIWPRETSRKCWSSTHIECRRWIVNIFPI